ncbi:asparagine synthase (glutamine-hydrolyzing) [bacterium]|nr:asparagine synthase (glutamine-hydrolyzing) [bacterium]
MCGIAGIVTTSQDRPISGYHDILRRMCGIMAHRGPDGEGFWSDDQAVLGHRRLAIIDLTESGRQPMTNEDGTLWITFNGEIYNFQELRDELIAHGHVFRSQCDTEAILHAYEQWGEDCVNRFRGMFAFAIWDTRAKRLIAIRDRRGKKPFFYHWDGKVFRFASELASIVEDRSIPRTMDAQAMDYYLTWGYVPAPQTAFEAVKKLLPGHVLTLDAGSPAPEPKTRRYWNLEYLPKSRLSFDDAKDQLREILTEAVRVRMISDVPLGAFLSGGIDSSIVVGIMAGLSDKPVRTFSIGFQDAAYNELAHARRIADKWSTDHNEFIVEPDAMSILPMLVRHYGEPYADSSAVPTYYVSQITRQKVTVALNGDGGDECFLGYQRYLANQVSETIQKIPGAGLGIRILRGMLPVDIESKSTLSRMNRFLKVAMLPEADRYAHWIGYFGEADRRSMYRADFSQRVNLREPLEWYDRLVAAQPGLSAVERANLADYHGYLPYDLLVKVDIATMANSLESRSPLLDHKLLEFAARLPQNYKLRGRKFKWILRQAFADMLPPENVNRQKSGFGVPIGSWIRESMKSMVNEHLLSDSACIRQYLDGKMIDRIVRKHMDLEANNTFRIWNLLMLEMWHQEFGVSSHS